MYWKQKFITDICPGQSHLSYDPPRLQRIFSDKKLVEESLKPLLPVIEGLMRFIPKNRISASDALARVRTLRENLNDREGYID